MIMCLHFYNLSGQSKELDSHFISLGRLCKWFWLYFRVFHSTRNDLLLDQCLANSGYSLNMHWISEMNPLSVLHMVQPVMPAALGRVTQQAGATYEV